MTDEEIGGIIWVVIFVGGAVLAVVLGLMAMFGSFRRKDPWDPY
jgi:hypothetical protein